MGGSGNIYIEFIGGYNFELRHRSCRSWVGGSKLDCAFTNVLSSEVL